VVRVAVEVAIRARAARISFRFVEAGLVPLAAVPLVYAGAMAVEAVAALATGDLFDRHGGRVLLGVPLVAAPVPPL
jgi:hypothetical protein